MELQWGIGPCGLIVAQQGGFPSFSQLMLTEHTETQTRVVCAQGSAMTTPPITQPYVQKSGHGGEGGRNGIHKCPSKISHTFL